VGFRSPGAWGDQRGSAAIEVPDDVAGTLGGCGGVRLRVHPPAEVARTLGRSPAQVLLRWGLQHGFLVLPKSTRAGRIAENAGLFDFALGAVELAALDALEEGLTTGWDPATQP
jgi:diketogulonate reductase-like aldo/keto reductase